MTKLDSGYPIPTTASRFSLLHLHPGPVRLPISHPTRGFIPEPALIASRKHRDSSVDAAFSGIRHDQHFGSLLHGIANAGWGRCHPTDLKKEKTTGDESGRLSK